MTSGSELRHRLMEQTRSQHERLHHHPLMISLLGEHFSQQAYTCLLLSYQCLYQQAESRRQQLNVWPELTLARAVSQLNADLDQLQCQLTAPPADNLFHWLDSEASCLGMLYVFHGSRLGNRLIHQHLASTYPTFPCAFFSDYRPGKWSAHQDSWPILLQSLQKSFPPAQADAMVSAAQTTFDAVYQQLSLADDLSSHTSGGNQCDCS